MTSYKKVLCGVFYAWLPFAAVVLVVCGLAYALVQQNYRQNANDPQVQIAQDVITALNKGQAQADSLVPAEGTTELGESLSPFLMVYSSTSTLVGSSILVNGKNPEFSTSALEASKAKGESRITWQAKSGARAAVIIKPFSGKESGFVVVGRSLKEVEMREQQALLFSSLAALAGLVLTFIIVLLLSEKTHKIFHFEKEEVK